MLFAVAKIRILHSLHNKTVNYMNLLTLSICVLCSLALQSHVFFQHVRLHFTAFNLDCCDYVYIYDGNDLTARLIRRLHGYGLPDNITSSGNTVFVYFTTNGCCNSGGFTIQYSTLDGKFNVVINVTFLI